MRLLASLTLLVLTPCLYLRLPASLPLSLCPPLSLLSLCPSPSLSSTRSAFARAASRPPDAALFARLAAVADRLPPAEWSVAALAITGGAWVRPPPSD